MAHLLPEIDALLSDLYKLKESILLQQTKNYISSLIPEDASISERSDAVKRLQRAVARSLGGAALHNSASPRVSSLSQDHGASKESETTSLEFPLGSSSAVAAVARGESAPLVTRRRSAFRLVTYAGDTREDLDPFMNGILTLPVHAKTYISWMWDQHPKTCLVMKKQGGDASTESAFNTCVAWLLRKGIKVVVEKEVKDPDQAEDSAADPPHSNNNGEWFHTSSSAHLPEDSPPPPAARKSKLAHFAKSASSNLAAEDPSREGDYSPAAASAHPPLLRAHSDPLNAPHAQVVECRHEDLGKMDIDFVVSLGGDGTFIHAAHAFDNGCPPILAFALGSLGFLTPFPSSSIEDSLAYVERGGFRIRLRDRLEIELWRDKGPDQEPVREGLYCALNEAVIDRGVSSSLVRLALYSNHGTEPVTVVQGDGLIMSTATGSTAYSLSAGGSMVHPSVPAICVTPICPHSLSFRPILVPDSHTLRVMVAKDARASAWISFDGRQSVELRRGDYIVVRFSPYPVPAVMPGGGLNTASGFASDDWLLSLKSALNWNVIQVQKS